MFNFLQKKSKKLKPTGNIFNKLVIIYKKNIDFFTFCGKVLLIKLALVLETKVKKIYTKLSKNM